LVVATQSVKIINGGKLVIPAQFRREMGIGAGDTVVVGMTQGELRIRSLPSAIKKAQAIVREFVPDHVNLVDELIADRRAEADVE
jgi:bifunctional DNA-binding transcriptional regulator/antitoxin component of YhaV-PrlF toxin-antitoxin module